MSKTSKKPETNELDDIAGQIKEWFPQCKMAFSNFVGYRFLIGRALIRARELVPCAKPGPKQLDPKFGNNYPPDPKNPKSIAAYNQVQSGILAWQRTSFPDIATSTLHDYKAFAERVIATHPEMAKIDLLTLAEARRDEVHAKLKGCVSGKDVTLCLRAMNEIPDAQKPGGDRGGRRPKKGEAALPNLNERKQMAHEFWAEEIKALREEGIDRKSWQYLDKPIQHMLLETCIQLNNMIRAGFRQHK